MDVEVARGRTESDVEGTPLQILSGGGEWMTPELFERLLFEEEGTTIDFKSEQYGFVNADGI